MSAEVKTLDTTCTLLLVDFPLNYFERYWQLAFIDDLRGPFYGLWIYCDISFKFTQRSKLLGR